MKEFILCAAIWINDKQKHEEQPKGILEGFVICGRRHSNCYQTITDLMGNHNDYFKKLNIEHWRDHQGFITSSDRYVGRKEAWEIARRNNQIIFGGEASDMGEDSILISENLY